MERAFVRAVSVPLLGGVRGGFRVLMHGIKPVEAFHEPERGTPSCQGCHGLNACEKRKEALPVADRWAFEQAHERRLTVAPSSPYSGAGHLNRACRSSSSRGT